MTYLDKLLKEIEDAEQWYDDNPDFDWDELDGDTEKKMMIVSYVESDTLKDCTYLDKLEEYELDAFCCSIVIEAKDKIKKFKSLPLQDSSFADYERSVKTFMKKVEKVSLVSTPFEVDIPLTPMATLYLALNEISILYDSNTIKSVIDIIGISKKYPVNTKLVKKFQKNKAKQLNELFFRKRPGIGMDEILRSIETETDEDLHFYLQWE